MSSPLDTFHNLIVLSVDPDPKYSPSSENTMLATTPECPVRVFICSSLNTFLNSVVLSQYPDAMYSPLLENPTAHKTSVYPLMVFRSLTFI